MSGIVILAALTFFRIDGYRTNPHLPDEKPDDAVETESFSLAAARDEFESVSFLACPDADMPKVDFKFGDLKGPGGATIPASAADLMSVKVWFQPDGLWYSYRSGNRWKPTPIPTLVLHDDALVQVDWEKKQNFLRFSLPEGTVYRRISGPDVEDHMNYGVEPVRDATAFVPFDLKRGRYQQYWLTWKVPADAKPGVYRGTAEVTSAGAKVKTLEFSLEVYPFSLPSARTHYDSSRPYMIGMSHGVHLQHLLRECHDLKAAEAKAYRTYKLCADHNLLYLNAFVNIEEDSTDDLAVRQLRIMRAAGMPLDPVFAGDAENVLTNAAVVRKVMDRELGHHNAYVYAWDEASLEDCLRQYDTWSAIKAAGFRIHASSPSVAHVGWSVDVGRIPCLIATSEARDWHADGGIAMSYAAPFTGPDCPMIWRHSKGLRFWYADFDGINDFVFYYTARNRWNEFIRSPDGYRCFGIVCPAQDAMVGTVALEALREGVDDVRYMTLLKLRAETAMRSGDARKARLGKETLAWIDSRDPERLGHLDEFRKTVVGRILKLVAEVGPQPEEPRRSLPSAELPPHAVDRLAADEKVPLEKRAKACEDANRYDLAIPLYRRLRDDASLPVGKRIGFAQAESRLCLVMVDRAGAIAALDAMIALKPERDKLIELRLAKASAYASQVGFREEFTPGMLKKAQEEIDAVDKAGGLDQRSRFDLVWRMAKAHLSSSEPINALKYAEERIAVMPLKPNEKGTLLYCGVKALKKTGRDDEAYELLQQVYKLRGGDLTGSFKLIPGELGFEAEGRKDYAKAQTYFAEALSYWPSSNDNHYPRFKNALTRVTKLARDQVKKDLSSRNLMTEPEEDQISLDE